jgi:bifunctional non-homologous end joining protein LigD
MIKDAILSFSAGSSDKEYRLQLISDDGVTYSVACQWGRKGASLQSGVKCTGVTFEAAEKVYQKLYNEKTSKGYVDVSLSGDASAYITLVPSASLTTTGDITGMHIPQLLNPIDDDLLERYMRDDSYGMQEKKDGRHVMGSYHDAILSVYNKKGKPIGYPAGYRDALSVPCVIDGEAIGDTFYVFDLLELMGDDLRGMGYEDRYRRLSTAMEFGSSIKIVPLAIGYASKKRMYDELVAGKKEGVVFKKLSAPYVPGRPSSLGDMLKYKFVSTCSVRVTKGRDGKRSIGMEILNGDKWEFIGHCTIPPNKDMPLSGVAEIRYLYAYKGGSLYQPFYIGLRDDVDEPECVIGQLKYKAEEE